MKFGALLLAVGAGAPAVQEGGSVGVKNAKLIFENPE